MGEIVISEFMDEAVVRRLKSAMPTVYSPTLVDSPLELETHLRSARALIVRNRTKVTRSLLESAPDLECVGRLGVGLDNIDLQACKDRGISVYPATGANNRSVAEYVITAAMALLRRAFFQNEEMCDGSWPRENSVGRELAGSTFGLVGFGAIAQVTSALAASLGARVIAYDPFLPRDHAAWEAVENYAINDLLQISDVVSLHVPLTAETKNLVGQEQLKLMKRDAVVVNASRGGVVDEAALVEALTTNRIGAAALDVFEEEPLRGAQAARFKKVPNVLLTPHIAGVTAQSNERVSQMISEKVTAHLEEQRNIGSRQT